MVKLVLQIKLKILKKAFAGKKKLRTKNVPGDMKCPDYRNPGTGTFSQDISGHYTKKKVEQIQC